MDSFIGALDVVIDDDLAICEEAGVAYQVARDYRVPYDAAYFAKVSAYEGGEIAERVNAGRVAFAMAQAPAGGLLLDYGCGSGAFLRAALAAGFEAFGFDVMLEAREWLTSRGLWADNPAAFDIVTVWDVLEHFENPGQFLGRLRPGAILLASVPIFADLRKIRASRHYRPGEHLTYWTAPGFIRWARAHGCELLGTSSHEVDAGRDSIGAFAFFKHA